MTFSQELHERSVPALALVVADDEVAEEHQEHLHQPGDEEAPDHPPEEQDVAVALVRAFLPSKPVYFIQYSWSMSTRMRFITVKYLEKLSTPIESVFRVRSHSNE